MINIKVGFASFGPSVCSRRACGRPIPNLWPYWQPWGLIGTPEVPIGAVAHRQGALAPEQSAPRAILICVCAPGAISG